MQHPFFSHHPKGLIPLSATEFWERFGYNSLQAILVIFLTGPLNLSDHSANQLYSSFSACLFLLTIIGGYVADSYCGQKNAITIGTIFFIIGFIFCAISGLQPLLIGLSLIIVGNAFFKPNLSCLLGSLYKKNDPLRGSGFTWFYLFTNIGGLIPTLFIGYLIHYFNWNIGFMTAGLGMLIALITFTFYKKKFSAIGNPPLKINARALATLLMIIITSTLALLSVYFPAQTNQFMHYSIAPASIFLAWTILLQPKKARHALWVIMLMLSISVVFWALYIQSTSSVTLFVARNTTQQLFGLPINPELTIGFNNLFIIILSPLLSMLWIALDQNKEKIRFGYSERFSCSLFFTCLSFMVLSFASSNPQIPFVSSWWIILNKLLLTIGELFIGPVGLAMITQLSPQAITGRMMGFWFYSLSLGFSLGGVLSTKADVTSKNNPVESLGIYHHAFAFDTKLALGLTLLSFCIIPIVRRITANDQSGS